ncbi:hypothetical protein B0J14DRAFT_636387 [Halenospora varia]|nr:hypothetical protein B0J14DRAFT_636387 [Halenospora varia]
MSLNFTSDSSSFPASLTLELSLSKSPPDLLGFSEVSGLYGPGTWAAWFLVIVASWLHLLYLLAEIEIKLDINMWAYLLGLNWAAVDLIRHSRHLSSQYYAGIGSEQWSKEAASVGAALTMVFWGSCGALAQLLLCWSGTSTSSQSAHTSDYGKVGLMITL